MFCLWSQQKQQERKDTHLNTESRLKCDLQCSIDWRWQSDAHVFRLVDNISRSVIVLSTIYVNKDGVTGRVQVYLAVGKKTNVKCFGH
jgi:hypothetical protein